MISQLNPGDLTGFKKLVHILLMDQLNAVDCISFRAVFSSELKPVHVTVETDCAVHSNDAEEIVTDTLTELPPTSVSSTSGTSPRYKSPSRLHTQSNVCL